MLPFVEDLLDLWVLILTVGISAMLLDRSAKRHRKMTPDEYEEWLVYGEENQPTSEE